jgi:hypothetical protein
VSLASGVVVGSYRISGVLGRGGMATVYGARHVDDGRPVALKILTGPLSEDPAFAERFRREGRLQASLEHPHVITVFEAGESEHGLFLAMRPVAGPSLATLVSERTLDAARALALLRQVADALDAAHAAGLVHRDVKPHNVLVGEGDEAFLGDFGLTRLGGATGITATGKLLGTVAYLAPEVIEGGEAVPASDRYAFAATLFECLTGTVVFPRRNEAAILFAHSNVPPPRISERRDELPAALDETFARALAKDPAQRPLSATELVDEVGERLAAAGAAALGPPPPAGARALESDTVEPLPVRRDAAPSNARRPVALWLALAALVGAAAGAAGFALIDGADDTAAGAVVPPPLRGTTILGSDLGEPGRTRDCRGRAVGPGSPSCTLVQSALPGAVIVVPSDGVIRRWGVRSARGELGLVVARSRTGGFGQLKRSRSEFVADDRVHLFDTDIAVRRGHLVGLLAVPGSGVGLRERAGASMHRWIPRLRGTQPPGRGPSEELLLRVEFEPGAQQREPRQVTGAEAAALPAGKIRARRRLRFSNGRPVEMRLVQIGPRFVLDELIGGRRTVRIDVPDFRVSPGARLLTFEVYAEAAPQQLGVYIQYVNEESSRILDHFFDVYPREIQFID